MRRRARIDSLVGERAPAAIICLASLPRRGVGDQGGPGKVRVRAPNTMLYRAYLLKEQLRQVFRVNGRRDASGQAAVHQPDPAAAPPAGSTHPRRVIETAARRRHE
jgi:hypothetical protein